MDETETGEVGAFPFREQPGGEIARGVEFRVLRHNDGWVVKEGIHPDANTLERLKLDKRDYEMFQTYIGNFLPETQHIRGQNAESQPVNIIRQREIKGKPLYEIPDDVLFNDPIVREQLIQLLEGCQRMWHKEGRVPDLYGSKGLLRELNPRFARNIMVEDDTKKVWLVDTSAHPLVFSKNAMLHLKPQLALLRGNMERLLDRLKKLQDKKPISESP